MAVAGFRIGIEVELLLSSKQTPGDTDPELDLANFAAELVTSYNKKTGPRLPRMVANLDGRISIQQSYEWRLEYDSSVSTDKERSNQCKYLINLRDLSFPYLLDVYFALARLRVLVIILYIGNLC